MSRFAEVIVLARGAEAVMEPLTHLESLSWPDPHSVQVLVHDEEDHCFGLWMLYDGRLTEVSLPRTMRESYAESITGVLSRTDRECIGEDDKEPGS